MNVTITFRGMKSSDAIREYVTEKTQKFNKYLRDPIEVHAICELNKIRHSIEMIINSHKDNFQGKETSEDMYVSIDSLMDKLETQMRRNKDKKISKTRNKARAIV